MLSFVEFVESRLAEPAVFSVLEIKSTASLIVIPLPWSFFGAGLSALPGVTLGLSSLPALCFQPSADVRARYGAFHPHWAFATLPVAIRDFGTSGAMATVRGEHGSMIVPLSYGFKEPSCK
jgi:hypothetical protein